nr:acyl-CoA dehydrogenase family protein [uncultured Roseococcus sp.]
MNLEPDISGAARAAADHADAVDREGRFPAEAVAALRESLSLGLMIPRELGGGGGSLADATRDCFTIGRGCASAGMVLAMHHIQVACLMAHGGDTPWQRDFLVRVAKEQLLLGSVTSEEAIGGNIRRSFCAPEPSGEGRVKLVKRATNISYGAHADALLLTARRDGEAAEADQLLWVLGPGDFALERTGGWDTMGMRGTRSEAFLVTAEARTDQALATGFGSIASETMTPVTHIVWAGVWLGIAADALDRTRSASRAKARQRGMASVATGRLSQAAERLIGAEAMVASALRKYGEPGGQASREISAVEINALKTAVSEATLEAVGHCMIASGLAGYRTTGPASLSRHLRDLWSGPLMIQNDKVREGTGAMLVASPPKLGVFL